MRTSPIQIRFIGTIDRDPSYHGWPTVVHIGGEELLAVCSGNREEHVCPFGRVFLYRSPDGGRSWTGPEHLSSGPLDDRDAGICVAANGSILVNYFTNILAVCGPKTAQKTRWRETAQKISIETIQQEHGFWMRRSDDHGRTWSEKYRIPLNNPHGPTPASDGSLIFAGRKLSCSPAYEFEGSRLGDSLVFARSTDSGLTWNLVSEIPPPAGHSSRFCFEPHAVEAADGRIVVQIRDQNLLPTIETWQTESADGGKTWKPFHRVTDGFPTHLLKIPDGRLLMSYGRRQEPFGIRCRFSADNGQSWQEEIILYDHGLNHDLGYPSSTYMPDGSFFTSWYENTGKNSVLKYCRWSL